MPSWRQISRNASPSAEPGTQPLAVARHGLRADGVQGKQHVIIPTPETADPSAGERLPRVSDQLCTLRRSFDERPKRPERQRRDAFLDLQRDQPGPRDPEVEAIVGRVARGIGGIVARPGREPHMPIVGRRHLGNVRLVAAHQSSELPARRCRIFDPQQEVPHHRHHVRAENEALYVREVEPRCCHGARLAIAPWGILPPQQSANKPWALHSRSFIVRFR